MYGFYGDFRVSLWTGRCFTAWQIVNVREICSSFFYWDSFGSFYRENLWSMEKSVKFSKNWARGVSYSLKLTFVEVSGIL